MDHIEEIFNNMIEDIKYIMELINKLCIYLKNDMEIFLNEIKEYNFLDL